MNREDEARRALERLERERDKFFHGTAAPDADDDDPTEALGKRIASILRYLMLFGLIVYVLVILLN